MDNVRIGLFGNQSNMSVVLLLQQKVILEKVFDATKNLIFNYKPVLLIEKGNEAIWPRGSCGSQTGEDFNHLFFRRNSTQELVIFSSDNRSKEVEHFIFNGRSWGGE